MQRVHASLAPEITSTLAKSCVNTVLFYHLTTQPSFDRRLYVILKLFQYKQFLLQNDLHQKVLNTHETSIREKSYCFLCVNKLARGETVDDFSWYLQERAPNSSSGFMVTDFIMPAREKPVSHPPCDPPLCESVSWY